MNTVFMHRTNIIKYKNAGYSSIICIKVLTCKWKEKNNIKETPMKTIFKLKIQLL